MSDYITVHKVDRLPVKGVRQLKVHPDFVPIATKLNGYNEIVFECDSGDRYIAFSKNQFASRVRVGDGIILKNLPFDKSDGCRVIHLGRQDEDVIEKRKDFKIWSDVAMMGMVVLFASAGGLLLGKALAARGVAVKAWSVGRMPLMVVAGLAGMGMTVTGIYAYMQSSKNAAKAPDLDSILKISEPIK